MKEQITLLHSLIRKLPAHRKTIEAVGLHRLNQKRRKGTYFTDRRYIKKYGI